MNPINGMTINQFWSRCVEGTRLTCLSNTRIPRHTGITGVVKRQGKTTLTITLDDGRVFWLDLKKRVRDVISLTDDTISYYLPDTDGQTVTWKIG